MILSKVCMRVVLSEINRKGFITHKEDTKPPQLWLVQVKCTSN